MKKSLLVTLLLTFLQFSYGQEILQENLITGSKDDFMIARHYKIKGTNREIGKSIAQIAKKMDMKPLSNTDTLKIKLKYSYLKQNYPIHFQRMLGVAEVYGIDINDYSKDLSIIEYIPHKINCSVVFYPGDNTENNHDLLSRNFDFSLGNIKLQKCRDKELPICSRPVVFEIYPDSGYASLYITAFDLLGGAIDGINSQGLSVAVLTEGLVYDGYKLEASNEVGLYELLIMRYLLDNCKNVKEAKEALLFLKQYYLSMPLHYIIADSQGESFVFEFSRQRNQSFLIDGNSIQCVTTHLLSNGSSSNKGSVKNLNRLYSMTSTKDKFSVDEIKEINAKISPTMTYHPFYVPSRTLWYALYDLDARSVSVKFYLGEERDPQHSDKINIRYSQYFTFKLDE